ncbi:MAG: DUF3795 domain-containing protein [Sedimentisphaerales bacterium]|nr:DUF3795 domain-containing protein [Sedimentisphaerales bacterium]
MASDREQTACCGLYCGDCIPANQSLFEAAAALRQQLDDWQFDRSARYKSTKNRAFNAYPAFRETLDAILTLPCPKPCVQRGGNPRCAVRTCVHRKGLEGCWQCADSETCATLDILCAGHGDTARHNLRMIRQHGVEHWSHARGKHYVWQKSHLSGRESLTTGREQ